MLFFALIIITRSTDFRVHRAGSQLKIPSKVPEEEEGKKINNMAKPKCYRLFSLSIAKIQDKTFLSMLTGGKQVDSSLARESHPKL